LLAESLNNGAIAYTLGTRSPLFIPRTSLKLTQEAKDRLFKAIKLGATLEVACDSAGIAYRTVAEWRQIGEGRHPTRRPKPEYSRFAAEIKKAIADSEMALLTKIQAAAQGDARHAEWILERRFPERWANSQRIDTQVEVRLEQSLETVLSVLEQQLSPADYERAIAAISVAAGGGSPDQGN
jgi:hypothetical protein